MEFKHINDCWSYLEDATTVEELESRIKEFPNWAGSWTIVRNERGCAQIINEYDEYGCYQIDREDTNIEMEEE